MPTTFPRPTDAELAILRVIWRLGPATVREIHSELAGSQTVIYTTVLKLLQIMTEKGLVARDVAQRAHVYRALLSEQKAQRMLVSDLLDRAFGGSTSRLVTQALSSKKASREELDEIRDLLDSIEEGEK
jgi:BlaI family transcriptional regulator, penicillinase repressor